MSLQDRYDFESERVACEIKTSGAKRVGLQFPEGLKSEALAIAADLEARTGATCIIYADPTYGACDPKYHIAETLGLDLVIHYGHTDKPPSSQPDN